MNTRAALVTKIRLAPALPAAGMQIAGRKTAVGRIGDVVVAQWRVVASWEFSGKSRDGPRWRS